MRKNTNKNTFGKMTVKVIFAVMGVAIMLSAALISPVMLSGCSGNTPDTSAPETTAAPVTTAPVTEAVSDTAAETEPEPEIVIPDFINPLTGLAADKDLSASRPAAIMINNIKVSCPQIGVRNIDVMYECLAEGGITRLLCLASDYAALGEVGSVRSARDYFIDLAQNHDALFVHAGGSPYAYTSIDERDIDNLDGVNMYLPDVFYRDQDRRKNMGYENSLMTSGEKIAEGIAFRKYRTTLRDNFDSPLDFVDFGTTLDLSSAEDALHVYLPFSYYENADMIYDPSTGLYDRYQFDGEPHIDGETGEQLRFANIFVLFCDTAAIPGDDKDRIRVGTVGSGDGYYITGGKAIRVRWEKDDNDSPVKFTDENGESLKINRGKTYIAVMSMSAEKNILLNKSDS